jgi:DNA-binding MarR family transcriptional regulator
VDRAQKTVEQWRRERPDVDANVMATVGRLLEAAQLMERTRLLPLAASFGLRPGEFDVIASLRRAGAPFELTPTQLYEALMLSSGAMTSRLDHLERNELIARRASATDRRSVDVCLTQKGLALIDEILPHHVENEREALSSLTIREQEQLDHLLTKLIRGLDTLSR